MIGVDRPAWEIDRVRSLSAYTYYVNWVRKDSDCEVTAATVCTSDINMADHDLIHPHGRAAAFALVDLPIGDTACHMKDLLIFTLPFPNAAPYTYFSPQC